MPYSLLPTRRISRRPSLLLDRKRLAYMAHMSSVWPNPSIERTFQRPLRALWPAAHVER